MLSTERRVRAAVLFLATAAFASGARAEDLRGPQTPDKAPHPGQQAGSSAPDAREAKPQTAPALLEEVASALSATPPAPEGEERRTIGESVRAHEPEIVRCYRALSEEARKRSGRLVARFDIGGSGKVIGATADGVTDPQLISCVVGILRKLSFDKPRAGGTLRVAYPFFFASNSAR